MGKKAPDAPDLMGPAKEQSASSLANINAQTQANRPNTNTAFASNEWVKDPNGNWTSTQSFSEPMQGMVDSAQQNLAASLRNGIGTGEEARDQAINAAYGQATSRLDPRWDQREAAQRSQLLNQGLDPSSEAYRAAMSEMGMQRNDAYGSAMNSAIQQGQVAGDSIYRNNLAGHQMTMADLQGLFGFGGQPNFQNAGAANGVNYLDAANAAYQNQISGWNGANAANADAWGTGLQTAGTIASMAYMSDERTKENIQRHDTEALPGVPFASWEYRGQPGVRHRGVIAQDLEKVAPQYVHQDENGIRYVDYSFLDSEKK